MKLVRLVSFSIIAQKERNPGLPDTKKNGKGNFKSKQETNFLTQQIWQSRPSRGTPPPKSNFFASYSTVNYFLTHKEVYLLTVEYFYLMRT